MPRRRKQLALPQPEKSGLELLADQIEEAFAKFAEEVERGRKIAERMLLASSGLLMRLNPGGVKSEPAAEIQPTRKRGRPKIEIDPLNPWNGETWECCGSRHHARHKSACKLMASDGKLPPDDPPGRYGSAAGIKYKPPGHDCCGSKSWRHKAHCPKKAALDPDGAETIGSEEKSWKCVNCDHVQKSVEQPEECDECPGTVFVEKAEWQE